MNLFVLANFIGQSAGGVVLGWVGEDIGIQWCYGVQGLALAVGVGSTLLLSETRADVLLTRRARRLRREGEEGVWGEGGKYVSRAELGEKHILEMIAVSCWRPLRESPGPSGPANNVRVSLHGTHRGRSVYLDRLQLGHNLPRHGVHASGLCAVHIQHRDAGHGAADHARGGDTRLRLVLGPGTLVSESLCSESDGPGETRGKTVLCCSGGVRLPSRNVRLCVDWTAAYSLDRAGHLLLSRHGGRERHVCGGVVSE